MAEPSGGQTAADAKILVLGGPDRGAKYALALDRVVIGGDADCEIRLRDPDVAGHHALLTRGASGWTLRALDEARPVEVDGRAVREAVLRHDAVFSMGRTSFRFQGGEVLSAAAGAAPVRKARRVDAPRGEAAERAAAAVSIEALAAARDRILESIGRIVVGQREVLGQIVVALFARGHCLLIGVPGLAKTLMVRTLADSLALDTRRIQFTPDLMPSDITGTDLLEEDPSSGRRGFRFEKGPLFTNLLLADEINRTPPKTQAALLEAMQEHRVTAGGNAYPLPDPFLVLATQNPIEQEGTYPLPEAQLDRFMFCVNVGYPSEREEQRILLETTDDADRQAVATLDAEDVLRIRHLVRRVPVSEHAALYAARLVRATRPGPPGVPDFVTRWVRWGAGPRAGQYLLLAAKVNALFDGRGSVSCTDIRAFALPVLRHRIFCNFTAASEGVTTDQIVGRLLEVVGEPGYDT